MELRVGSDLLKSDACVNFSEGISPTALGSSRFE